jgi:SM-20-related protein
MINIRILLRGGHVYETACAEDAPLLKQLSEVLSHGGKAPGFAQLTIETDGKNRGLAIPYLAIIAVETEPPIVFRAQAAPGAIERAPYIRIPDFLAPDENQAVLDYALSRQSSFDRSRVETGVADYRHSQVLLDLGGLSIDVEGRIREIMPDVVNYFGIKLPAAWRLETQLTTHNDGGYFKVHNDNGSPGTADRLLTYVYYFHRAPVAFAGGQLRLYDSKIESGFWIAADTFAEIKPENNTLLLFPSRLFHEVVPTRCESREFADGRFTINGWVRSGDAAVP